MATVSNVNVMFQPTGASSADAVAAANQHVYIDLTAGTMSYCRTNASGRLVGANGMSPVSLDDTRSYQVMVSSSALGSPPASTSGTSARVTGGRLTVVPQIGIKVVNDAGAAVSRLACTLEVGGASSSVTTSTGGWVISNNQATGAVVLKSN